MNHRKGTNLHIYPASIENESRIFRETAAVAESGLFSYLVICGRAKIGLNSREALGPERWIERVGADSEKRNGSTIGRILDQIRWSFSVYSHFRNREISLINAHSVAVLPVCYLLSRKHRVPLIYDTHELETQTQASMGLQGKIFKFIEKTLISKCALTIVVNESIAEWYRKKYSCPVLTVRNIPQSPYPSHPVPLREQLSIPGGKRLYIHSGNVVVGRHVGHILAAFEDERVEDHIVFLGQGTLIAQVRESAARHNNIHYLDPVKPDEVINTLAGGDLGLCLIELGPISLRYSLPNKAFEYALAGVPFFFTDLIEVRRLLGPTFDNWVVEDPVQDLVRMVTSLSSEQIEVARKSLSLIDFPTWETEAQLMITAYRELLASRA